MSKSVRDYTSFAAKTNSNVRITRQNVRLNSLGVLRLLLVCSLVFTFLLALPSRSYAQPTDWPGPNWWDSNPLNNPFGQWQPTTTPGTPLPAPPPFPQAAPYAYLWTNEANWTGVANRYTSSSVSISGSVRGGFAYNSANTLGNAYNHWWVGNADTLYYNSTALNVTGSGSIYLLGQLTVEGNLTNSGQIYNTGGYSALYSVMNPRNPNGYLGINVMGNATNNAGGVIREGYILGVGKTLQNSYNSATAGRGIINNMVHINVGSLQNYGLIDQSSQFGVAAWSTAYITVSNDLINGYNTAVTGGVTRTRRSAEILSDWYYGYDAPPNSLNTGIYVGGNLIQWFDGSIRARGGSIDVVGELYNAGEIRINEGLSGLLSSNWFIRAGTIYNDGRSWTQWSMTRGLYDPSAISGEAWGIIYDAQINTIGDLTNIGVNAVIDATVNSNMNIRYLATEASALDTINSMHVGGTLYNLDRADILNYNNIVVHGDLVNRGALLVGGSWSRHSNMTDHHEHVMHLQVGSIDVWQNVYNTSEDTFTDLGAGGIGAPSVLDQVYGGLIASFDVFNIHGSLYNDANSMITGSYTHDETGPYGEDGNKDPYTIYGRRASILGGVMLSGEYHDAPTLLNVMGIFSNDQPGQIPFHGLYNEGHIREIDIISVGSNELGILWNTPVYTAAREATLTNGAPIGAPGMITDIGVINVTNLYNAGTISDIDVAINVSYALVNDVTGVINGLSTFHVEWQYDAYGLPIWDYDEQFQPMPPVVFQETRADLRVGKAGIANPLVSEGIGIINYGTITNFNTVTSLGDMYNFGQVGGDVLGFVGGQGSVTALIVGSNMDALASADLYNFGELRNIDSVTVVGDLFLEPGSFLHNVGTVTARNDVLVNLGATVNGGFNVLNARDGDLRVAGGWLIDPITGRRLLDPAGLPMLAPSSGSLMIERGAVATGNTSVRNDGLIVNNGLLNSAMGIDNRGIIVNNGMISAFSQFYNRGLLQGNGVVTLASNGIFENAADGVINGGVTINGNFRNTNGTIIITAANDVTRVTNGGTATIVGGVVDAQIVNPVVGRQYMFMAADNPGNLLVSQALRGLGSGDTGSVLDFVPTYGYWDGDRYAAGREWSRNQYYWLEVQRAYSYGTQAVTPNQVAVGRYLDTIGTAPKQNSALWNMFVQLDAISDDPTNPYFAPGYREHQGPINPAALQALEQLSGVGYANLGVASVHNIGVVNRSLADVLRSDVFKFSMVGNPNNAIRGQAIAPLRYNRWGTLFGIGGTSKRDSDGVSGYSQSFGGLMAGVDRAFWTGTRLGGYVSAATGDISMKQVNESADVTNVMVGMYLRQEMYFGYWLASAGFGVDNYKMERDLTMIGHRAESKFNATVGTFYLERGIDIPVYYATFQPYANFQAVAVQQDKFNERMWDQNGQYTNVGLEGIEGKTNSYRMAIGARSSSMPVIMPWGQLAMTTNMAWYHEFCDEKDRTFVARFANPGGSNFGTQLSDTTFTVRGNNPQQDWFNFGFGLNIDRNSTRFFLGADLFANDQQTMFSGNGGFVTVW